MSTLPLGLLVNISHAEQATHACVVSYLHTYAESLPGRHAAAPQVHAHPAWLPASLPIFLFACELVALTSRRGSLPYRPVESASLPCLPGLCRWYVPECHANLANPVRDQFPLCDLVPIDQLAIDSAMAGRAARTGVLIITSRPRGARGRAASRRTVPHAAMTLTSS